MSTESVLKTIADEDIEYVDIRFTDPRGKLQHVTVMSDQVDADFIEEGFMFDGSSIAGWKSIEASDMKLMMDTNSAYVDPFYAAPWALGPLGPWAHSLAVSPSWESAKVQNQLVFYKQAGFGIHLVWVSWRR